MKSLLVILPYVPYPLKRGTYQRVYHLAEELAKGFHVDLFCLRGEDAEGEFPQAFTFARRYATAPFRHPPWRRLFPDRLLDPLPTTVQHWWSPTVLEALRSFVGGKTYDRVWFCDLVLWPYVYALFPEHPTRILDRSRVDWLFQTEELRTLKLRPVERFLRWENLAKIRRLERHLAQQVALEIVCGEDDLTFLRLRLPNQARNVFVLPNGVNERLFDAQAWPLQPTAHPSAIYCGALDYTPNVDALRWYFETQHRAIREALPTYELLVVGKNPTPELKAAASQLEGVRLVGEVPDVRPWYQQAWLQLVPLRIGGGTRLKIPESLAMGVPVVSTTLGAQGLDLRHEHELWLADTPETLVAGTVHLLRDAAARQRLAAAGRARVLERYTWSALGGQLRARLDQLA